MLALLLGTVRSHAIAYLEVESVYEGDGWFRYSLKMPVDYFTPQVRVTGFALQHFGPVQEMVVPPGWTAPNAAQAAWLPTSLVPRPSQHVFRCRSAYRDFKKASTGHFIFLTLPRTEDSVYGIDQNGAAWCAGLVPCPPAEADNSASTLNIKIESNPDLKITQLYFYQGKVTGISLNWRLEMVYVLEASSDLITWHEVSTFLTTYSGSANLDFVPEPGPFFRVRVFEGNSQGLAPTAPVVGLPKDRALLKGTKLEVKEAATNVTFPSQAGTSYTVEFLTLTGESLKKVEVTGVSATTTVTVPASSFTGPIGVRVFGPPATAQ